MNKQLVTNHWKVGKGDFKKIPVPIYSNYTEVGVVYHNINIYDYNIGWLAFNNPLDEKIPMKFNITSKKDLSEAFKTISKDAILAHLKSQLDDEHYDFTDKFAYVEKWGLDNYRLVVPDNLHAELWLLDMIQINHEEEKGRKYDLGSAKELPQVLYKINIQLNDKKNAYKNISSLIGSLLQILWTKRLIAKEAFHYILFLHELLCDTTE